MLEVLESRVLFVAGDLDTTFGAGGIATADFGVRGVQGIDVAAFGDKIYAAGFLAAPDAEQGRAALAAFDPSGRPDPILGGHGTVSTDVTVNVPRPDYGEMLVQPDGKIVLLSGGYFLSGAALSVARFNPDGPPDLPVGGGDAKG